MRSAFTKMSDTREYMPHWTCRKSMENSFIQKNSGFWTARKQPHHIEYPGRALTLERGMGMCRGHDPPFSGQSPLPSPPIYRQCTALMTPFSIFMNFLDFQPCFGQNSSSLDPNFSNFHSQDPQFSMKIHSLDRTFWNPRGTHPPKKSWVPPPR